MKNTFIWFSLTKKEQRIFELLHKKKHAFSATEIYNELKTPSLPTIIRWMKEFERKGWIMIRDDKTLDYTRVYYPSRDVSIILSLEIDKSIFRTG
jgi:Fe2+ or Zn2+ uptake regulation protein